MQYTEYTIGFFSEWSQSFRTSIDALSFGRHENHNYNIWWLAESRYYMYKHKYFLLHFFFFSIHDIYI